MYRRIRGRPCSGSRRRPCSAAAGADDDDEPRAFEPRVPPPLPADFRSLPLLDAWPCSADARVLRFRLPDGVDDLRALGVPSGVKVRREVRGRVLDKSYSPVSLPAAAGHLDLLVKRYPADTSEGLGAFLCAMRPGDCVDVKLKPRKLFSGRPAADHAWENLALVGCGTGVCPLFQMAAAAAAAETNQTEGAPPLGRRIWFVSAHRSEDEFLLREELDDLARQFGAARFRHVRVVSEEGGRVRPEHFRPPHFPAPGHPETTRVVVCGTDGFLETVAGPHVRVAVPGKTKKRKLQGPLDGLLRDAGFVKEQVTKL